MKTKLVILLLLPFLFSCQNEREDLIGHWHVKEISKLEDAVDYNTIDFVNDTFAVWNKGIWGYDGTGGYWDKKENEIRIGGECFFLIFDYKISNDSLFLTESEGDKFFAERCEGRCCDKQKDFFREANLSIDLPIVKDTLGLLQFDAFNRIYERRILYGFSIGHHPFPRLKLNNQFATTTDIETWLKIQASLHPKDRSEKIVTVLYANKEIIPSETKEVLEQLKKLNQPIIYLALREENTHDAFKIWWKKVDLNQVSISDLIDDNYEDSGFERESPRSNR